MRRLPIAVGRRLSSRALVGFALLLGATFAFPATRMALVGDAAIVLRPGPVPASAVAQALATQIGPGAEARAFPLDSKDLASFQPNAIVLFQGSAELSSGAWRTERDRFVPRVKARLAALLARFPQARIALGLPASDAARAVSEVIPLLRQAAREAGAATIDLSLADGRPGDDPASIAAGEIALSLADFRSMKKGWKLVFATSEETDEGPARFAIDGDPETYWHTRYTEPSTKVPHELVVDLGVEKSIRGFRYVPRQDGGVNGRVKAYEIYVSLDGKEWGAPVAKGEFPSTAEPSRAMLPQNCRGRYVRFVALSESNGGPWTSMAELDVIQG